MKVRNLLAKLNFTILCLLAGAVPASAADFQGCLAGLRGAAAAAGVSFATFDRHTAGLAPDMTVLELMVKQPEFRTPIWDYMASLVDAERIADGRAMLAKWKGAPRRCAAPLRRRPRHRRRGVGRGIELRPQ